MSYTKRLEVKTHDGSGTMCQYSVKCNDGITRRIWVTGKLHSMSWFWNKNDGSQTSDGIIYINKAQALAAATDYDYRGA